MERREHGRLTRLHVQPFEEGDDMGALVMEARREHPQLPEPEPDDKRRR
jgi:hypothetical protein